MLIVGSDPDTVERELAGSRLACPHCCGPLGPWGYARRRPLRLRSVERHFRPRRARCRSCRATHVLLPYEGLVRRRDSVAIIGSALVAKAGGRGHRTIAETLDLPPTTVRGWLRRFGARAGALRVLFVERARAPSRSAPPPEPTSSAFADAVAAVFAAANAGLNEADPHAVWWWASAITAGGLLANTS